MIEAVNLAELEALARARLSRMAWDYYASGADDERCVARNCDAYDRIALHYRVLVDVATRELSTTVLGQRLAMPIAVAPTAFHKLAHRDGELATVRAAGDAGTLFILSTLSNTAVEEVVAAATGPVWFQLYVGARARRALRAGRPSGPVGPRRRAGVTAALAMLRRELDLAFALCGCADVASVTRDLVEPLGRRAT